MHINGIDNAVSESDESTGENKFVMHMARLHLASTKSSK